MPGWSEILEEVMRTNNPDIVRRRYLKGLSEMTGRNVIAYYSGFLSKNAIDVTITDNDMNGFMNVVKDLDCSKGLDLILHTPGGDLAATESIVKYLRSKFGNDIRAIVPQMAMSAGTMISCSCKSIVMGKQSSLGPIDPQLRGVPASGVIEEFEKAKKDVIDNPKLIPISQKIIEKYHPTFIGECEKAIKWSEEIVTDWLASNMFADHPDTKHAVEKIVGYLSDHGGTKTHSRHINAEECRRIGLNIEDMESDNRIQDLILSIHHSFMITFSRSNAIKVYENHSGRAMVVNGPAAQAQQLIPPNMFQM